MNQLVAVVSSFFLLFSSTVKAVIFPVQRFSSSRPADYSVPVSHIKTPSLNLTQDGAYQITASPGESIQLTTVRGKVSHITLDPSGAPAGVTWSTSGFGDVDIFLNIGADAQVGSYSWNQSMKVVFVSGRSDLISPSIQLSILATDQ